MSLIDSETGEVVEPFTPPPITSILEQVRRGDFSNEAGIGFANLIATCIELQRAGQFALTIKVKPDDNMLKIEASWAASPPKSDPSAAIFFADDRGGLHRNDPNQPGLFG